MLKNLNHTKKGLWGILLCLIFVGLIGCDDSDKPQNNTIQDYLNLPETPYNYTSIEVPAFLDKTRILSNSNVNINNPITDWGATLGRVLFYDVNLSKNNTISCASCHKQSIGFSDEKQFSEGFLGGLTGRHSMGLANAQYRGNNLYFWDGRANSIEEQVLMPIQDAVEMGMNLDDLVAKLETVEYYPLLFKEAFGSEEITSDKISKALGQFVRSLHSFNSRYDQGRSNHHRDSAFANFTDQENHGKRLFFDIRKGNCGGCHSTDAFIADVPRNNGLDVWETSNDKDIGYEKVTGSELDRGKFITPSLRNIGVRPPYMHDGRFATLMEVVNHYSDHINGSATLDPHLKGPNPNLPIRFNLSEVEKQALIAFMHTLTDQEFLTDKRFSDPF